MFKNKYEADNSRFGEVLTQVKYFFSDTNKKKTIPKRVSESFFM